jgi:hypothetical protein
MLFYCYVWFGLVFDSVYDPILCIYIYIWLIDCWTFLSYQVLSFSFFHAPWAKWVARGHLRTGQDPVALWASLVPLWGVSEGKRLKDQEEYISVGEVLPPAVRPAPCTRPVTTVSTCVWSRSRLSVWRPCGQESARDPSRITAVRACVRVCVLIQCDEREEHLWKWSRQGNTRGSTGCKLDPHAVVF